jgi:YHS domain-containing protein
MQKYPLLKPALLVLALSWAGAATPAFADKAPVFTEILQPAAAGGYDVVSFFSGTPQRGGADFTAQHAGYQYRFASAANRAKFLANPTAYLPQYGGYCAWAVSQGYTAPGRPQHWKVVNGKLYFNYNASIQEKWARDIPTLVAKGDQNWPNVLKK